MSKIAKTKNGEDRIDRLERYLAESAAEFDRRMAKWEADRKKAEAKAEAEWAELRAAVKATNSELNGYTHGAGESLEQEYIAAVEKTQRVGDFSVSEVHPNPRSRDGQYERDLAWGNGKVVIAVEIKTRFTLAEVRKLAKVLFPQFAKKCPHIAQGRKVIGAIGGGSISKRVREEAEKFGLLVLGLENRKLVVKSDKSVRAI